MKNLKLVDFKAVAALGCFVYCYLRADGSPYYVGIAKLAHRPIRRQKSDTKPPRDHSLIRVLRFGLTWEEAQQWERFFIARYGRKDLGTGILRNKTDGGDGVIGLTGYTPTDAARAKMKAAAKRRGISEEIARLGRQQARLACAVNTAKRRQEAADALGVSVEQLLAIRAKENAIKSGKRREQKRKALGMTVAGFRRWMADGQPSADLSIYQELRKPNRVKTQAHKQKLSQATTAFFQRKAAEQGLTLDQAKAAARKRKREKLMANARALGMTKREYQAFVKARRQVEVGS